MEPKRASRMSGDCGRDGHRRARYAAAGSAVLLAGGLGYVGLVDPHDTSSIYPQCPFRLLTGWNCPACGGLRMMHDLLHGDLAASINDNVFLLVGIPMLAAWVLLRRHRGQPVLRMPAIITVAVSMVAWTVLRNLPGFPLVPTVLTG
uniref:DUF2752 domain-containing protein n=2 Tax=Mycobacterium riyadhense TaxID=486698 RepID=A0A653EQB9_9MYCO|nr:hypothetical protein BIN_B_03122 [Mycobacterium riyadhense]